MFPHDNTVCIHMYDECKRLNKRANRLSQALVHFVTVLASLFTDLIRVPTAPAGQTILQTVDMILRRVSQSALRGGGMQWNACFGTVMA